MPSNNENVENIGARRLHTVLEILLEDISFSASDRSGEKAVITAAMVEEKLAKYTKSGDLSKFISDAPARRLHSLAVLPQQMPVL